MDFSISTKDILQPKLELEENIRLGRGSKDHADFARGVRYELDRVHADGLASGLIIGLVLLSVTDFSDEKIIEIGKWYVVKYITPAISIMQEMKLDLEEQTSLPNDPHLIRIHNLVIIILQSIIDEYGQSPEN